ncbi:DUF6233 domain-containing protein [Streptomyces olivochromogenes]|uniref:DUF6233 domain-containing protein n=1 Tax=Streptomyces olivochromogenes TaxID=1963 RepID=UPI0035B0C691
MSCGGDGTRRRTLVRSLARWTGEGSRPASSRARTPVDLVAASVHLDDCKMAGDLARPLSSAEARMALVDEQLEACGFCCPDMEVGIDIG